MTSAEKPYPVYAIKPPQDIADGSHSVTSLEAKLRQDQVTQNDEATATVTTTTPGPKSKQA